MPSKEVKISSRNLKEYSLSEFFFIQRGNGLSRLSLEEDLNGVNFISRQSFNNGVNAIVKEIQDIKPFPEGCITVALGGEYLGSAFIQNKPFYTAAHIAVLFPKNKGMSDNVKWFICTLIRFEAKNKFCAFGRELDRFIDYRLRIKLPTKNNKPDWSGIEQYMASFKASLEEQMNDIFSTANGDQNIIKSFAEKVEISDFEYWLESNAHMDDKCQLSFNNIEWDEFLLDDYFNISPGIYYSAKDYENGTTPYISASNQNNGICKFISLEPDFKGNCIITGKVGCTAFYQKDPFCATSDVNVFQPKFAMTPAVALFIVTQINLSNNYKYNYGRQCRVGDSKKIKIFLPKDKSGEPNWEWIEHYMSSLPYSDKKTGKIELAK